MKTAIKKKRGYYVVEISQGVQHFDINWFTLGKKEAEWMKNKFDEAIENYNKEYISQQTAKLEKDLKDAKAMLEKMELTASNLEKKVAKQEELARNCRELIEHYEENYIPVKATICNNRSQAKTRAKTLKLMIKIAELKKQVNEPEPMVFEPGEVLIREAMIPIKICPLCGGNEIKTKVSFKGRLMHRKKRKIQYCVCGWSRIIPTTREVMLQLGLID